MPAILLVFVAGMMALVALEIVLLVVIVFPAASDFLYKNIEIEEASSLASVLVLKGGREFGLMGVEC